ncbi:hypothetical protein EV126DRAFT_460505, partial [Verticillium dahliae]
GLQSSPLLHHALLLPLPLPLCFAPGSVLSSPTPTRQHPTISSIEPPRLCPVGAHLRIVSCRPCTILDRNPSLVSRADPSHDLARAFCCACRLSPYHIFAPIIPPSRLLTYPSRDWLRSKLPPHPLPTHHHKGSLNHQTKRADITVA